MTDDTQGPKDPGPEYRTTSSFASFVMHEDESEAAHSDWLQTIEHLGIAIHDAEYERGHFQGILNHMEQVLAETGYHELKRLRKAGNEIAKAEWKQIEPIIEILRSRGFEEIVELIYRVRGGGNQVAHAPSVKSSKGNTVELLKALAERAPFEEADSARIQAEKITAKHHLPAKPHDPFDFDLEDLEYVEVRTPIMELSKALDAELEALQHMADIFYRCREVGRKPLEEHHRSLMKQLNDPHMVWAGRRPIITARRSS